jgi:hypothetical protein
MRLRPAHLAVLAPLAACAGRPPPPPAPVAPVVVDASLAAAPDVALDAPVDVTADVAPADAGVASSDRPAFVAADAPPSRFAGETVTALAPMVAVYYEPRIADDWRGYLRAGGTARIVAGPLGHEGCPERPDRQDTGWYQVEGDGYVCASRGLVLTRHLTRAMRSALPGAPALDAGLPYRYATASRSAVVYRALPGVADEQLVEPARAGLPVPPPAPGSDRAPTLETLAGEAGSPVLRRMLRGMYVAVERATRAASGASYWRSHGGGYVRTDALAVLSPMPLHGARLSAELPLPVALVSVDRTNPRRLGADGLMYQLPRVARLTAFPVASTDLVHWRTDDFLATRDGRYLRRADVTVVTAQPPPPDLLPNEHWIDVNLDRQSLVAYEGATPVFATLVSTGIPAPDQPASDYETIQGGFRLVHKHVSTTMDGNAAAGAYSIEDVPWAMYFEESFALHGAYWHGGFGAVRSHGCVNLAPDDARWLFGWTTPTIPAGWHAAFATATDPGTRIYVHYDRQRLGESGGPARVPGH